MRAIPKQLTKRPFTLTEARAAGLTRRVLAGKACDAGYRLLRFTAGDVLHNPESVVALVRSATMTPR